MSTQSGFRVPKLLHHAGVPVEARGSAQPVIASAMNCPMFGLAKFDRVVIDIPISSKASFHEPRPGCLRKDVVFRSGCHASTGSVGFLTSLDILNFLPGLLVSATLAFAIHVENLLLFELFGSEVLLGR